MTKFLKIISNGMEGMWKEAVVALHDAISQHMPGRTEENNVTFL